MYEMASAKASLSEPSELALLHLSCQCKLPFLVRYCKCKACGRDFARIDKCTCDLAFTLFHRHSLFVTLEERCSIAIVFDCVEK